MKVILSFLEELHQPRSLCPSKFNFLIPHGSTASVLPSPLSDYKFCTLIINHATKMPRNSFIANENQAVPRSTLHYLKGIQFCLSFHMPQSTAHKRFWESTLVPKQI
eukprot:TRINITY_DN7535_c0_g5_i1.p1 TRINITY_DN7535_c0_g5~~TRINITY_DN7535_c0_g5_i1.p1  ORF type:complete len:107 (+),score=9.76 TRINITY_DN7535_c0_g5_i1:1145-1465(+)